MLYVKPLLAYITLHPDLAYAIIFLVAFSESLVLAGLIVPGTVIMFGVGAIVGAGSLSLGPVLLVAAAGAVAGDGISFWLGHHYHQELRRIWPFSRYPGLLQKGEKFFNRHGGKSVLFGRFVGPVRPVIPVVAGMLGMPPLQFAVVNILSAIGWALAYTLPGVFLGTTLAVAGAVSSRLAVLGALFIALVWIFGWLSYTLLTFLGRHLSLWLAALRRWVATQDSGPKMSRMLKRLLSFFFQHQQGEEVVVGLLVLLLLLAAGGFLVVLREVLAKEVLVIADQAVYHFFQSLRTPLADQVLITVTELGDALVNTFLCLAVFLVLFAKRLRRTARYWTIAVLGGLLIVRVLKLLLQLPRPVAIYHGATAYSFPSGHTTMSVVIYGFLAIFIARNLASKLQWGIFVSVLTIAFVIALSRLYLGAHWLSDVLGGFLIGTSWTALLGVAYMNGKIEIIPRRLLAVVVILVLLVVGGLHVRARHESDLAMYAPRTKIQDIALQSWLDGGWRRLPGWRIDLEGEQEQPLTIQFAGSIEELKKYLLQHNWQPAPPLTGQNILKMFAPDVRLEELPVLPRLHDGRFDRLQLVRPDHGQRAILRLWPTDMQLSATATPLFVGTIEDEKARHLTGLVTLPGDTGHSTSLLTALRESLLGRFAVNRVERISGGKDGRTSASVLLIRDKSN